MKVNIIKNNIIKNNIMKKNNIIAAVAALTLALTACQNDDNLTGDNTGKTPIELNFSVGDGKAEIINRSEGSPARAASTTTRATGSAFEVADKVGVFFAAKDATTLTGLATDRANHLYTLGDKGWTTAPLYWDDLGSASATSLDLYGYYPQATTAPLNTAGTAIAWTSPTDQSTAAKLTAADLLLSNNVKAYTKATTPAPTLTFTHTMAKLRINLVDNSGDAGAYTQAELAAAEAIVKGLNTKCEVAFVGTEKTVSGAATPTDITPMKAAEAVTPAARTAESTRAAEPAAASTFEAIVVPQTVAADATLAAITITSGTPSTARTYSVKAGASGFDLQQGKLNTLTVTITQTGVNVNMTVTDWGTGSSENKAVVIDGITTGTAGTNDLEATAGDVMKLFYVPGADKDNITITYTYGSDNQWTPDATLYWDAIVLTGYSKKFAASYTPGAAAAATTPEKDLLEAAATIDYGSPINLAFTHAMAQLTINLKAGTGFTNDADLIAKTTLKKLTVQKINSESAPAFDPATAKWTFSLNTAAAMDFVSGTTYTLAPQDLTDASTIVLTIANGNTYTVKLNDILKAGSATEKVFTGGKIAPAQSYTLNLTVNNTNVNTTATVTPWNNLTGNGDMETEN